MNNNIEARSGRPRLEAMLAAFDPKRHGGEVTALRPGRPRGALIVATMRRFDNGRMNKHRSNLTFRRLALLSMTTFACANAAGAEDGPAVTPYRPSVSTPANLSAPGWLEVEAGVQRSRADDPQRRDTLPYTLKLAFTPDWGIRIGGDAFVRQLNADGSRLSGGGDTTVVLKRRFEVNSASAFGGELSVKIPTARGDLGSGHTDVGVNGIYSADFAEKWHVDLNATATHLGGVDPGTSSWQQGWAAALSRNLTDKWSAVAELSGTQRGGATRTSQALVATSYSVAPALVVDVGVSKGLNTASGGWSVFTGVTFLTARVF